MPGGLEVKFQEFSVSEIIPKIARVIRDQKKVKIWKKEEGMASSFLLSLSANEITFQSLPDFLKNEDDFLFSFGLDEMTYLFRGRLIDAQTGLCEIEGKVYRTEKRVNERLLTYPNHRIFLSFLMREENPSDNVLSFHKHKNEELKFLKDFTSENTTQLQFRIMDLSIGGVSLFVNKNEALFFEDKIGSYVDVLNLLSFGDKEVQLEGLKVVYVVDCVNPRAKKVPMKKVGLSFQDNTFVTDFLQNKIDSGEYLLETEEQFEIFLNSLGE